MNLRLFVLVHICIEYDLSEWLEDWSFMAQE